MTIGLTAFGCETISKAISNVSDKISKVTATTTITEGDFAKAAIDMKSDVTIKGTAGLNDSSGEMEVYIDKNHNARAVTPDGERYISSDGKYFYSYVKNDGDWVRSLAWTDGLESFFEIYLSDAFEQVKYAELVYDEEKSSYSIETTYSIKNNTCKLTAEYKFENGKLAYIKKTSSSGSDKLYCEFNFTDYGKTSVSLPKYIYDSTISNDLYDSRILTSDSIKYGYYKLEVTLKMVGADEKDPTKEQSFVATIYVDGGKFHIKGTQMGEAIDYYFSYSAATWYEYTLNDGVYTRNAVSESSVGWLNGLELLCLSDLENNVGYSDLTYNVKTNAYDYEKTINETTSFSGSLSFDSKYLVGISHKGKSGSVSYSADITISSWYMADVDLPVVG